MKTVKIPLHNTKVWMKKLDAYENYVYDLTDEVIDYLDQEPNNWCIYIGLLYQSLRGSTTRDIICGYCMPGETSYFEFASDDAVLFKLRFGE